MPSLHGKMIALEKVRKEARLEAGRRAGSSGRGEQQRGPRGTAEVVADRTGQIREVLAGWALRDVVTA